MSLIQLSGINTSLYIWPSRYSVALHKNYMYATLSSQDQHPQHRLIYLASSDYLGLPGTAPNLTRLTPEIGLAMAKRTPRFLGAPGSALSVDF